MKQIISHGLALETNAIAGESRVSLPFKPKTLISLWDMIPFELFDRQLWLDSLHYRMKSHSPQSEIPAIILEIENVIKFSERYHLTVTKAFSVTRTAI
jgi:hypothetical protein